MENIYNIRKEKAKNAKEEAVIKKRILAQEFELYKMNTQSKAEKRLKHAELYSQIMPNIDSNPNNNLSNNPSLSKEFSSLKLGEKKMDQENSNQNLLPQNNIQNSINIDSSITEVSSDSYALNPDNIAYPPSESYALQLSGVTNERFNQLNPILQAYISRWAEHITKARISHQKMLRESQNRPV